MTTAAQDVSTIVSSLAMIYGAVEAMKFFGVTNAIKDKVFGTKSLLTSEELAAVRAHHELCRGCARNAEKQVELLQKLNETATEIRAEMRASRKP